MIKPSALNFVIVAAMVLIFSFLWNVGAASLLKNNPNSPIGRAMAAVFN